MFREGPWSLHGDLIPIGLARPVRAKIAEGDTMDPKKIFILCIFTLVLGTSPVTQAQEIPELDDIDIHMEPGPWEKTEATPPVRDFEPKDLKALLSELVDFNPEMRALVEKINALDALVKPAGSLEDPRFSFEGSNIPISPPALNRTPMTGLQIYYRQKVPWPGKLKLRSKIAKSKAEQEKQEYYERFNQLVAKFKQSFFEFRKVSAQLAIYQSTGSRFRGLEKFLEARYSAGETPQQDILKNKVEISTLDETIVELKQRKNILLARMNTLLNRPAGTDLKIKDARDPLTPLRATLPDLVEVSARARPWLKKSDLQIQQADYEHQLAKKGLLPDFDFGAGWRFRQNSAADPVNGEDFFSAGFSMTLPVFGGRKQKNEIAAAYHHKKMQNYLKQATTQEVRYQVEQTYHQLQQLKGQLSVLNGRTLPQARVAVESSRVNYEADEVDFLNVLTNEVALLKQKLKQAGYRYEYEKKIAELEMVTGLPIHVLNDLPKQGETHAKAP